MDNSYKSAATNAITFSAIDPKRADEKMYELTYDVIQRIHHARVANIPFRRDSRKETAGYARVSGFVTVASCFCPGGDDGRRNSVFP